MPTFIIGLKNIELSEFSTHPNSSNEFEGQRVSDALEEEEEADVL